MFTSTSVTNIFVMALVTAIASPRADSHPTVVDTATSMLVKNEYACQNSVAIIMCDIQVPYYGHKNGCRWWQNNKELNRSSRYQISQPEHRGDRCYLKINDVRENPDAKPTDYRCKDNRRFGRVIFRLWTIVELPVNSLVLTVGGQEVENGGTLNLTALSHLNLLPAIQCSVGPVRPAAHVTMQLQPVTKDLEEVFNWVQEEESHEHGQLFSTNILMLVKEAQPVAGQTLRCQTFFESQCQRYGTETVEESLEITIIGNYERQATTSGLSAATTSGLSAATSTNPVFAEITVQSTNPVVP